MHVFLPSFCVDNCESRPVAPEAVPNLGVHQTHRAQTINAESLLWQYTERRQAIILALVGSVTPTTTDNIKYLEWHLWKC